MSVDVTCPFCGENGFDLIGLKSHLTGDYAFASGRCEVMENIETSGQQERRRRAKEGAENG